MSSDLLNTAQAAKYLGLGEKTVRRLLERGEIAHHRLGRLVRFSTADLDAWVASTRVEARPQLPAAGHKRATDERLRMAAEGRWVPPQTASDQHIRDRESA